jgi:hypothetical protein
MATAEKLDKNSGERADVITVEPLYVAHALMSFVIDW